MIEKIDKHKALHAIIDAIYPRYETVLARLMLGDALSYHPNLDNKSKCLATRLPEFTLKFIDPPSFDVGEDVHQACLELVSCINTTPGIMVEFDLDRLTESYYSKKESKDV